MEVETYEVTELDSETGKPECEAEAIELIEKLGLKGQQSLLKPDEEGERQRCPYRLITQQEAFTFKILFPKYTKVEDYHSGPIPLRVLQVIAHARELFETVFIRHPEDARDPDPILCGTNKEHYWSGFDQVHILARWGEALESIDKLTAQAAKIFRAQMIGRLKGFKASIDRDLDQLKEVSDHDVLSVTDSGPSYFGLRLP